MLVGARASVRYADKSMVQGGGWDACIGEVLVAAGRETNYKTYGMGHTEHWRCGQLQIHQRIKR